MSKEKSSSAEGIGSIKTTSLFKALNFELYVKPNLIIMAIGSAVMAGCVSYIAYIKYSYEKQGYYTAVTDDGSEQFLKKTSKWD